jgi:hypothetical protein
MIAHSVIIAPHAVTPPTPPQRETAQPSGNAGYRAGRCRPASKRAERDEIQALDYRRFFDLIYQGTLQASDLVEATDAVACLTATKTKAELLEASFDRSLLIAPVATTADTLAFEQFHARDFWEVGPSAAGGRNPVSGSLGQGDCHTAVSSWSTEADRS